MRIVLLISIVLLHFTLSGQNTTYEEYYKEVRNAKLFEAKGDLLKANIAYKNAFKLNLPFPDDVIDAIACNVKLNNKRQIKILIKKLILSGYKTQEKTYLITPLTPNNLDQKYYFPFRKYQEYFDSIYVPCRKENEKRINIEGEYNLSTFKSLELFICNMRKSRSSDTTYKYTRKLAYKVLRSSLLKLEKSDIDISRKHTDSWLDMRFLVGVIHAGQNIQSDKEKQLFLAFLKRMFIKGNIHPVQYAIFLDDLNCRATGKTIFGERFSYDADNQTKFEAIEDIKNVDRRRAEIFLPPLWVKSKRKSIPLPKNYKIR